MSNIILRILRGVNDYIYGLETGSENVAVVKNALENKPDLI